VTASYAAAFTDFKRLQQGGWADLPFFQDGSAERLASALDAKVAAGQRLLPAPLDLLNALRLTPLEKVRAVILGQDPYPTPGDAHGLAFSVNPGVAIPRSLGNIIKEMASDLGLPRPAHGNLAAWAGQGVLLLNTCLTVEAGKAGSHRGLGWESLTDQMIQAVSQNCNAAVFMLWGADAQKKAPLIDGARHCVIKTAHPSPLSARRGFFGSRPFSTANAWLKARGRGEIDWRLTC
jgi:uracil-DNA glycosylase